MSNINEVLLKISCILNKEIFVLSNNISYKYPSNIESSFDLLEIKDYLNSNYNGYNVYSLVVNSENYYILIKSENFYNDESIKIALSMIELSLNSNLSPFEGIIRILSGNYDADLQMNLAEKYKDLIHSYLILIDYPEELKSEYIEIIKNSIDVDLIFEYNKRLVFTSKNDDIEEACNNLAQNILSEIYTEPTISIGGKIKDITDLYYLYKNSLKASEIKYKYKIFDYVISYDKLLLYRIVSDLDNELKNSILTKVFNSEFKNILDNEFENTIEHFYKNNLNITETANSIHVHRNTLLYRIDKIQKYTGFDLRKFEDSYIFKLAWLIRKELSHK